MLLFFPALFTAPLLFEAVPVTFNVRFVLAIRRFQKKGYTKYRESNRTGRTRKWISEDLFDGPIQMFFPDVTVRSQSIRNEFDGDHKRAAA